MMACKGMMEMVKKVALTKTVELVMSRAQYQDLIEEMWQTDPFLREKYSHYSLVPTIYSLYGVKLKVI